MLYLLVACTAHDSLSLCWLVGLLVRHQLAFYVLHLSIILYNCVLYHNVNFYVICKFCGVCRELTSRYSNFVPCECPWSIKLASNSDSEVGGKNIQ